MIRWMTVATMFTVLGACTTDETGGGKEGLLQEADLDQLMIYHGSPVDQSYHDATVSLHLDYGAFGVTEPYCSGTLIFDRWVLTAAHCLDGFRARDILVHFGEDGTNLASNVYDVANITVHSGYNPNGFGVNDVGLIELSQAATFTTPVMPLPASIGLTSADEGLTVDLAGFGLQEDGSSSELLHIDKVIADVRNDEVEYDQGTGFGTGSGGVCSGDSGGPAYFERNGEVYVSGVTSYGDVNCTDFGVSMKVDNFESWIELHTGEAVDVYGGGGGVGPVTVTDNVSGTLTTVGQLQGWTYTTLAGGVHEGHLEGAAGTDFDLYLARRVNNRWKIVASATTNSSVEDLVVTVPASGEWAMGVVAYSGTGDYTLDITRPQ